MHKSQSAQVHKSRCISTVVAYFPTQNSARGSSIVTGRSGPPLTHVFFSRFYVRIFHVKINLDRGCLLGVGYFFSRGSRMFERCRVFFF